MAFLDGSVKYGTRILKLTGSVGSGKPYIGENITITRPSTVIQQFNELGEPAKSVVIPGWVTLNGTLQYPHATGSCPIPGDTFGETFSGSAEVFRLTNVSSPEVSSGEAKIQIDAIKLYN